MAQPQTLQPPVPLPSWTWLDLEQTLFSLAETPHQAMVVRHFLASLLQEMPTDARSLLLEVMRIVSVVDALPTSSAGIDPLLPRRLHG